MSNQIFDRIPELAHIPEGKFVNECTRVLQSHQARRDLKGYAQSIGVADYAARDLVPATRQETADLLGMQHEPRLRAEVRLQTRPGQKLVKNVRVAFCPFGRKDCHTFEFNFPLQFLGYGPYTLSFYKPGQGGRHSFHDFFSELVRHKINFHRTLLFCDEAHEGNPNPVRLLLKKGPDPRNADINPAYLQNLKLLVKTAKRYNIVVQVCLFFHHTVAGDSTDIHPPAPLTFAALGNTPVNRYRNFYHCNSSWRPLQERLIRAVTRTLMNDWNVVYEVGNELRIPKREKGDQAYANADLRNWVSWAADLLHRCSYGKLVTTSTGTQDQNEAIINKIPRISFGSFHGDQWDTYTDNKNLPAEMQAALDRSKSYGPGHHLVIDDDGHQNGRKEKEKVREWAFRALRLGGEQQASFNHKGPYRPWIAKPFSGGVGELEALSEAWSGVFTTNQNGFPVPRPKPNLQIQP